MTRSIACFFLLLPSVILASCGASRVNERPATYANPINIDYAYSVVQTSRKLSFRSGADPAVVPFRDKYYMFTTRTPGYWMSDDLTDWEFIRPQKWFFETPNAPGAWPIRDSMLIVLASPSGWQNVIYTDNPELGTWEGAASLLPLVPVHDPGLFVDDDGRVYMYRGSSSVDPIYGVQLDPEDYFLPSPEGEDRALIELVPEEHGWERSGENHDTETTRGFIEGAWMNKHNGTYYLQYAAPGTQWGVYGDGVYTSDHPLGPFTYEEYSPFSYKPGGFMRGAGHGSTVEDPYGNYWHYATMVVGINFKFERRIGQFPAGFDEDGKLYANTAYGDYPHYLPSPEKRGREDWFAGWMLLSYQKSVDASSYRHGYPAENIVDENIKSFWLAETPSDDEWLTVDLGEESEIRAIQINYADYESRIYGKPDALYHQYVIESSDDGETWEMLVDKRDNTTDVPNDYVELAQPRRARYVRFTNVHVPTPNLAISDLRIFGTGSGNPPGEVSNLQVDRNEDPREARLTWGAVEGAQGYHLYYGIDPDKLYNSVMIYQDTTFQLNALNVKPDYYFSIEAFNENGISERSPVVEAASERK